MDSNSKPFILIVDDEQDVREFLKVILDNEGYNIIEADSGKAALETAAKQGSPISLMITDVLMPHMHGKDLSLRMRSILPHLKILYMSGYGPEILAGLNLCPDPALRLRKPLDTSAILTAGSASWRTAGAEKKLHFRRQKDRLRRGDRVPKTRYSSSVSLTGSPHKGGPVPI